MTFWATLWYAGAVVVTLGFEGQTLEQCENLTSIMEDDIASAYNDPSVVETMDERFQVDRWSTTCETEMLPIDEKYAQ